MSGLREAIVDDAILVLSELLSNACRHGRPLPSGTDEEDAVRAAWRMDESGRLTVEVTDGGGPTRPLPATPSVTARGGRGLNIITQLAEDWGVRDEVEGDVTVWARLAPGSRAQDFSTYVGVPGLDMTKAASPSTAVNAAGVPSGVADVSDVVDLVDDLP